MLRDKECGVILMPGRLADQRRAEEGVRRHDPQQHGRRDRLHRRQHRRPGLLRRPSASSTTSPEELKSGLYDGELREHAIDRIYDTLIDEDELRICDETTRQDLRRAGAAAVQPPRVHPRDGRLPREQRRAEDADSIVYEAYKHDVPIFCPAFSDCSAGFGLVAHQASPRRRAQGHAGTAARTSTS